MLHSLLSRGYFPQELPPPFSTTLFADFVSGNGVSAFDVTRKKSSKLCHFNLARAGSLRRELGIPNPIHYARLADALSRHWRLVEKSLRSTISLTSPKISSDGRALSRTLELDDLPRTRARIRSRGRYVLLADVARFYPSIYTHSIPWVLHGKAVAKARRFDQSLPGNELDTLLRSCQDQQTMGVPVGPDSSLVIAELILSHVDRILSKRGIEGIRYIDDYELVFSSEESALKARSLLQGQLQEMELNLGPAKTRIERLPLPLREPWLAELRRFPLKAWRPDHKKVLLAFFDRAFELAGKYPDQGVLKYSAGRVSKLKLTGDDALLAEELLVQCARVEAGSLAYALAAMMRYPSRDRDHERLRRNFLINVIVEHAPQRHSSEVAWALWAMIVQDFEIKSTVAFLIAEMNDPVCMLLALHAREKKLLLKTSALDVVRSELDEDSLYGPNWLLTYEGSRKGWFRFRRGGDFVLADPNFGILRRAKVSFYDRSKTLLHHQPPSDLSDDEMLSTEVDEYISGIVRSYDEDDWWGDSHEEDPS